jgi:hypothetical protein
MHVLYSVCTDVDSLDWFCLIPNFESFTVNYSNAKDFPSLYEPLKFHDLTGIMESSWKKCTWILGR